ncbi:uncharacterized protein LOC110463646 [Mizuhopecten yessoensis]|uniref:cAMP-dependent protein kinase regulatory subunit n=1 Tax=Mizuhopecten yessoensis TaxID=6573 RepID=A0A210PVK0_MIZYE|nr:uncharacterized protein LOC110463646 [Mizuhopecten yessoensis]XP_021374108.1 uncharacterized protein LOC110463646 [Mizuhopecten yessoensis]XP_021374109.1 uncharacterized protein LOC110463646 [Mizuhopecten yessoensis]XP_021374110.1 uncharacterized protein LOC110463646 [Mizuhopecten yessoensis]XP_021374111.1 uncharacterized protein LOC110463646 [Mizuhopecten yessoensis]XP_021374112.1 uncharacterized protein LOC110463646 [Mizuhopecten yessoensis]OWF40518.1 cAMP-dependent protein kinase regula
MPSLYEKVVSVIEKDPDNRTDFDCQELIGWFRNKSPLFLSLKQDILKDVIRHCVFEKKGQDDVIIKQGENGDRLYIILKGKVSIYVYHDKENEQEIRQHVERVCSKVKLERSALGQHVWTSGDGQTVGEIALIKEDCIRTASVVVDTNSELLVIDRALYNRSVRDVLEKEFREKTEFVESNPLFEQWTSRQRKAMAISLKSDTFQYGCRLTKQRQEVDNVYFIRSGEAEVIVDQGSHRNQYPELWAEMERLLPELLPPNYGMNYSPYETLKRKRIAHRQYPMCLLGANEIVGALELVIGLPTFIETCTVTRSSEILVLSKANYQRLFHRRSAARAVDMLKDTLCMRLFLYIHRSQLSDAYAPFLKYLTIKLRDTESLKLLKSKHKRRTGNGDKEFLYYGFYEYSRLEKHDQGLVKLMKVLDIHYMGLDSFLPELETSTRVLMELEKQMKDWKHRSRGGGGQTEGSSKETQSTRRAQTANNGTRQKKKYVVEALNEPPKLEAFLRSKTTL